MAAKNFMTFGSGSNVLKFYRRDLRMVIDYLNQTFKPLISAKTMLFNSTI
jgi:hypothetical protein